MIRNSCKNCRKYILDNEFFLFTKHGYFCLNCFQKDEKNYKDQADGTSFLEEEQSASQRLDGLIDKTLEEYPEWGKPLASPTGSLRYNKGKAGVHQVPPEVIIEIAKVLDYGATKYSEFNWAKGNNLSVPYACAMRHLLAFWGGEDNDKESGLSHLSHVMTNIMMLMYYKKRFPDMDDRFFKEEKKETE